MDNRGARPDLSALTPGFDEMSESGRGRNDDTDWGTFDPDAYAKTNYADMLAVDRQILQLTRDFFAGVARRDCRGLDVGAGPNLYPALSMLPFCTSISLVEYAPSNVIWLERQVAEFDDGWLEFWAELVRSPAYSDLRDPRATLAERATVIQGSVFELPRKYWDMGTMFFVACSISADIGEFELAIDHFVGALHQDAPFAAAFMLGSTGYDVNGVRFPAVSLSTDDLERTFGRVAYDVTVHDIKTNRPIRPGYHGMALTTGRVGAAGEGGGHRHGD